MNSVNYNSISGIVENEEEDHDNDDAISKKSERGMKSKDISCQNHANYNDNKNINSNDKHESSDNRSEQKERQRRQQQERRKGQKEEEQEVPTVEEETSYLKLLIKYNSFRLFVCSLIITYVGEWLTYIASISLIEKILEERGENLDDSRTYISILVVIRLLPDVIISPLGGALADMYDQRKTMMILDIIAGFIVSLFILAKHMKSINMIYFVTFLQEIISGLYEPCRQSIVPILVPDEIYQTKAYTLGGVLWSLMAAIGSAVGGLVVSNFGYDQCFLLDIATYMASAFFIYLMKDSWNACTIKEYQEKRDSSQSLFHHIIRMTTDGVNYLRNSFFGPLIFLKSTAAIIYGVSDVLNVSFAEVDLEGDEQYQYRQGSELYDDLMNNDTNSTYDGDILYDNATKSSAKLGYIFAAVGVGCFIGPLLSEPFVSLEKPYTLQISCILSIGTASIGCIGMGLFSTSFNAVLFFTIVRAAGSAINWINSSLLIQKFTDIELLGRMSAFEMAFAFLAEAFMAYICGVLQDEFYLSANLVAIIVGMIGVLFTILWSIYHICGMGAANIQAVHDNNIKQEQRQQQQQNQKEKIVDTIKNGDDNDDDDNTKNRKDNKKMKDETSITNDNDTMNNTETSPLLVV